MEFKTGLSVWRNLWLDRTTVRLALVWSGYIRTRSTPSMSSRKLTSQKSLSLNFEASLTRQAIAPLRKKKKKLDRKYWKSQRSQIWFKCTLKTTKATVIGSNSSRKTIMSSTKLRKSRFTMCASARTPTKQCLYLAKLKAKMHKNWSQICNWDKNCLLRILSKKSPRKKKNSLRNGLKKIQSTLEECRWNW